MRRSFLLKLSNLCVDLRLGTMNLFDCREVVVAFQLASIVVFSHSLSSILRAHDETPQNGSGPMNLVDDPILARVSAHSFPSIPQ